MIADHGRQWTEVLGKARPGSAQLVVAGDIDGCLSELNSVGQTLATDTRMVLRTWQVLPTYRGLLNEMLDCLARLALAIWPDWYCSPATRAAEVPSLAVSELLQRSRLVGLRRNVSEAWLRPAVQHCLQEQLPRTPEATAAFEAEQLSLVVMPLQCVLVLAVVCPTQSKEGILGLARVAEWLASEAQAALVVVVPPNIAAAAELDSISYGSIEFGGSATTIPPDNELAADEVAFAPPVDRSGRSGKTTEEWLVTPLIGRPHPNSKGEQLLWDALRRDPELCELFRCNQRVETLRMQYPTNYLVDLLWGTGKLVVEVDGYYWHSGRDSFSRDRQRDFELVASGHLVLRLPHDEVVADVGQAVEKIRTLVRFRRSLDEHLA